MTTHILNKTEFFLYLGFPGSGAVYAARQEQGNLAEMDEQTCFECNFMYAGIGMARAYAPYRAPHHTVSAMGLLGGNKRPGEVSLAHGGILVLEDVGEFRMAIIEDLFRAVQKGYSTTQGINYPCRPQKIIMTLPPVEREIERLRKTFPEGFEPKIVNFPMPA